MYLIFPMFFVLSYLLENMLSLLLLISFFHYLLTSLLCLFLVELIHSYLLVCNPRHKFHLFHLLILVHHLDFWGNLKSLLICHFLKVFQLLSFFFLLLYSSKFTLFQSMFHFNSDFFEISLNFLPSYWLFQMFLFHLAF